MKLELGGGQWADLRDRLTYGQGRDVRVALDVARTSTIVDLDIALVRAYVASWNVLDIDGSAVAVDTPELAPDDVIQAIARQCMDTWNGKADPKDTPARSRTTLRAVASK